MRQLNDGLSRGNDLSRFSERRDDRSAGIGHQGGVGRFVLCDFRFRFRRIELRLSRSSAAFACS